jgi:upstream activation factor subunit UAF30
MPAKKKPAKTPVKKVVAKPSKKAPAKKVKRMLNPALMKPIHPDAVLGVLGVIVGSKPLHRSAMTKKLWDYIKKNSLQDAKKRTQINADDALKARLRRQEAVQHVRDDEARLGARQITTLHSSPVAL